MRRGGNWTHGLIPNACTHRPCRERFHLKGLIPGQIGQPSPSWSRRKIFVEKSYCHIPKLTGSRRPDSADETKNWGYTTEFSWNNRATLTFILLQPPFTGPPPGWPLLLPKRPSQSALGWLSHDRTYGFPWTSRQNTCHAHGKDCICPWEI